MYDIEPDQKLMWREIVSETQFIKQAIINIYHIPEITKVETELLKYGFNAISIYMDPHGLCLHFVKVWWTSCHKLFFLFP